MTVMAGMGDGVDAVGEDLRIAIIGDGGDGWYGWKRSGVFRHKRKISTTDKLVAGWMSREMILQYQ